MLADIAHRARAERHVAMARLALAAIALTAAAGEPADPVRWSAPERRVLVAYTLCAVALAALAWRLPRSNPALKVATHLVDVAAVAAVVALTGGAAGTFVAFSAFALLAAALRFGARAVAATAGVVALLPALLGADRGPGPFLQRSALVFVAAFLLARLAASRDRLSGEIARVAAWPRAAGEDRAEVLEEALASVRDALRVPRALLVWEDEEEPWLELALLGPAGFETMREVSGAYEPIVAPELASLGFVQTPGGRGLVTTSPEGAAVRPSMPAVNPALADRFSMKAVLSPRLEAQRVKARLFALDRADVGPEDLLLAEVVAGLVASRLDQLSLVDELQETAATAERVRLARDLHDGILQDLAGIALQLEALRPLLVATREARGRLDALERVLETEQRDVRSVIQQLRPRSSSRHEFDLAANLEELKGTFAATWGLTLEVSGAMRDTAVPPRIRYELFRIVREAVSNAARHAGASRVHVSLAVNGSAVQVRAADDGHGFPFFGRYDLAELDKMRLGPVTLKERIAALGGSLVLDSSSMGSTLDIRLPLDPAR